MAILHVSLYSEVSEVLLALEASYSLNALIYTLSLVSYEFSFTRKRFFSQRIHLCGFFLTIFRLHIAIWSDLKFGYVLKSRKKLN